MSSAQSTQTSLRPHIVELGVGQPDPMLLPRDVIREATDALLARTADGAPLAYGANAGPEDLRLQLTQRIAISEREPSPGEILITGGNSQALHELCALLAEPGDAVLVEAPSYNFALQILRERRLQLVPVEMDDMGLVHEAVRNLRRKDIRVAFLYTIPTFHNPTGVSLADRRRRELLEVAANDELWILEDDVYRDLFYSGSAPQSLWQLDDSQSVVRLGTFSKILAPGLRVGWMTGPTEIVGKLSDGGLRMSGGGVSHFSAMAVAQLVTAGRLEPHLEKLRATYRSRRDALSAALRELIPEAEYKVPSGGYFIWVKLPRSIDTQELLPAAEKAGVAYVPGREFYGDNRGHNCARLSFTMYPTERLREGVLSLRTALAKFHP